MVKDYFLATLMVIVVFGLGGLIWETFGYLLSGIKSPLSKYLYPTIYTVTLALILALIFR
jgi:hypothetical protein